MVADELVTENEAFVLVWVTLVFELNVTVPVALVMAIPPPLPAMVFVPPLKLYVPLLAPIERPVLVPLVVTLPLKLMVFELFPAMVTAVAPLAWLMVPPQVMVPPLPPLTLKVAPEAPVS